MSKIVIHGGMPLKGEVRIDASKNAVLPILAASLLTSETVRLHDVPWIDDVDTLGRVLTALGAVVERDRHDVYVHAEHLIALQAPERLVRRMRASFLVIGPLLARFGYACVPMPGGCAIGSRPIDLHLKGLAALGAEIQSEPGLIEVRAKRLKGATVYLDYPSVGATENLLMAASLAEGVTTIENAAEEPEVVDLANFLCTMGADIRGAGTKAIRIAGRERLHGCEYAAIPDRIEAGTFLVAAAATGGDVSIEGMEAEHLKSVLSKLREAGAELDVGATRVRLRMSQAVRAIDIKTLPYPGFPTDMQPQFMALLTKAKGTSVIGETVFENRFMHVPELLRLGAHIKTEGRLALVRGVDTLRGTVVQASDLRAAAALVVAGLIADGTTTVEEAHHLDRGYRSLERKLACLGAHIERVDFSEVLS